MNTFHAVVWIDHDQAHVIHFNRDDAETLTVRSRHHKAHQHTHHDKSSQGKGVVDGQFFTEVEAALGDAKEILIVGPAGAKVELETHMKQHAKDLAACVVGIEPVDHPSDGQLLAMARKYFHASDQMR